MNRPRLLTVAAAVVVGLVALVAVGMRLVDGVSGSGGGAGSPEGAVHSLADALSREDVLGVLAMLAPEEVRSLDAVYSTLTDGAAGSGWVAADNPLAGVQVDVGNLNVQVDRLSPDVAKVRVTGGTLDVTVDRAALSHRVNRLIDLPDRETESLTSEDLVATYDDPETGHTRSVDPFMMTVRRGGRWYVSPSYTSMEYARELGGLPEGDFDRLPDPGALGAASPEEVVERTVAALEPVDVDALVALMPPEEVGVVHAYRDAITTALERRRERQGRWDLGRVEQSFEITVDELEVVAHPDGDRARVAISRSAGTIHYRDDRGAGEVSWDQDGPCGAYATSRGSDGEICAAHMTPGDDHYPLALAQERIGAPYLVAVEQEGRWHLSPASTLTDYVLSVLTVWDEAEILERATFATFGAPELSVPDRTIALAETVTATADDLGLTVFAVGTHRDPYGLQVCTSPHEATTRLIAIGPHGDLRLVVWSEPGDPVTVRVTRWMDDCHLHDELGGRQPPPGGRVRRAAAVPPFSPPARR